MNFDEIENKHKKIIDIAKNYMINIKDYEHDINHMNDVVLYTKQLLNVLNKDINPDVCIISSYWHDVGRMKADEGHEKISAEMLKQVMEDEKYDKEIINQCYLAIENHKWNMKPKTMEGLLIKDADKLAWIGTGRWNACIKNKQRIDSIINLLPKLKNEILYFDESKLIYDRDIINIVKLLYENSNSDN